MKVDYKIGGVELTEKEFSKLIRTNILGEFTDKEGYYPM